MAILNHGVPFMTDNGMSSEKAAMIISYASGVLIIGKIAVGMLYDKLGVYKTNLIEAVLFLVCFIAFWMNGLFDSPILYCKFPDIATAIAARPEKNWKALISAARGTRLAG